MLIDMSLEEEIAIVQFAQGVYLDKDLLDQFSQLSEKEKEKWFFGPLALLRRLKLTYSDIGQAITDSLLTSTDTACVALMTYLLKPGATSMANLSALINLSGDDRTKAYKLLLHVFKIAYQQRLAFEASGSTNWWYWDLSSNEVVQNLLKRHQELIHKTYINSGFRSEFVSLAKLYNDRNTMMQSSNQGSGLIVQTQFDFLTYDELMTECIVGNKYERGRVFLLHSLQNALTVEYRIDSDQAGRLVMAVIDQHMQETFNTRLL
ncbi:DUF5958 family protein [Spirosoma litoris]